MAEENKYESPSQIVSRLQSASIEIMNARITGRKPNVPPPPKMEDVYEVNGQLICGPEVTTKRERQAVASAMVEHIDVANGVLPRPLEPIRFIERA